MKFSPPQVKHLSFHGGSITVAERERKFGQRPATIWLTGFSGAGKSTLAYRFERRLFDSGYAGHVLDGDNIRHGLNKDLGFSPEHRKENIRRVAEVARLFNEAGLFVIASFISPYRDDRQMARDIIGPDNFMEVWLSADIATCEKRDPKGLYKKVRAGDISHFTGITAPYEPPLSPDLALDTGLLTIEECVNRLYEAVSQRLLHKGEPLHSAATPLPLTL